MQKPCSWPVIGEKLMPDHAPLKHFLALLFKIPGMIKRSTTAGVLVSEFRTLRSWHGGRL